MKDITGAELKIGDWIVYSRTHHRSSVLGYAVVIEITRNDELKCRGYIKGGYALTWRKTTNPIYLGDSDKILHVTSLSVPASILQLEIQELINELEEKENLPS